ncbi:MAG: DNA recombination protein RmuC, partial [Rubricoccaceae bacterium]|nr:DNA recombination protein RmuC [Rubricoccaceae bacterium]
EAVSSLVKPLKEAMDAVKEQMQKVEKDRVGAYEALKEQVTSLTETQKALRSETSNLVTALRAPQVRGRWGEIQLRRVVEMAGMVNYCDFEEQTTFHTDDGRLRPDMIIRLPNERRIVVDSKAPLQAYLEALEAQDDAIRETHQIRHAKQVKEHIKQLGAKSYTQHLGFTPEFIVLFLPGETFFSAALEQDPGLIEHGVDQNVILATPTTLIALLKAVHYGWRQEALTENAMKIKELGEELYKRTTVLAEHFSSVGTHLNRTVGAYNKSVGSLERRFLPSLRQFKELGAASGDEIPEITEVTTTLRSVESGEQLSLDAPEEEQRLLDS